MSEYLFTGVRNGEDVRALFPQVVHQLHDFFVALYGVCVGAVDGDDHDQRRAFGDECVEAVLQLSAGVAFGMEVGGLFELECALASNCVVEAAAEVEEVLRVAAKLS